MGTKRTKKAKKTKRRKFFSLMELMVVMALLALLFGLTTVGVRSAVRGERLAQGMKMLHHKILCCQELSLALDADVTLTLSTIADGLFAQICCEKPEALPLLKATNRRATIKGIDSFAFEEEIVSNVVLRFTPILGESASGELELFSSSKRERLKLQGGFHDTLPPYPEEAARLSTD